MRYLGIDYGRVRVGVAISDEEGRIAFPHAVLQNRGRIPLIRSLKKIIQKEKVRRVIMGFPRMLDGKETEETARVQIFAVALKKEMIVPVVFADERFTTRLAESAGVPKNRQDAAAAAIILQSYLDRLSAKR